MKKLNSLALASVAAFALSAPASAEYLYGFGSVSANYLDWTNKAEERASWGAKEDFLFLELEGGAGFDWGDVYGFIDLENAHSVGDEDKDGQPKGFRMAAKGSIAYKLGANWNLYGQLYNFTEAGGFFDQNYVVGTRYDIFTDYGFWMKPFVGAHFENQTYNGTGFNGYMAGWVLGYDFKVGEQKFSVSNWHETEFLRKDQFRSGADGRQLSSVGHNGSVALWWHLPSNLTAGIQYRYFDNKLGDANYGDALIYTMKYNF